MKSRANSIIYCVVKFFSCLMMILPMGVCLFVGRMVGHIGYMTSAKRKRIAYQNLRIAFCATKTDAEIRKILKETYIHFGQNIVELLRLPIFIKEGIRRRVTVIGEEHFTEALARKKGVIFLSIHSGNWELSSLVGSMAGYPYNLIANPQSRNSMVDELLNSYRKAAGCKIINPGEGTREILRRLKSNEVVSLVADQGGQEGVLVDFFGRKASMSTGAVRLAQKYGIAICLVDIFRKSDGSHCLVVDPPLELVKTGKTQQEDLQINLQIIVSKFEEKIKQHPHEYMWYYKIWKYTNSAHILILDDGRTGHLRQSQSLAKILSQKLELKGKQAVVHTVRVAFLGDFFRRLSGLLSFLSQWFGSLKSLGVLKCLLDRPTIKALTAVYADFIISCGSTVSEVNYLTGGFYPAKKLVILKPGVLPYRCFDFVVLPDHDATAADKTSPRMAVTRAALNLVDDAYMAEQKQLLLSRYSHLKKSHRTKIGILMGGNTKNIEFTESVIKMVIHQVKEVAIELNADILLTTSRRTPENIEQLIWREFKKFDHCVLLISAVNADVPEAVGGILGLSDCVLVSGESISMVSEAISSGKKTVVFNVNSNESKHQLNKYEQFVENLSEQGYIAVSSPKGISKALYNVLSNKMYLKPLTDRDAVGDLIQRIL